MSLTIRVLLSRFLPLVAIQAILAGAGCTAAPKAAAAPAMPAAMPAADAAPAAMSRAAGEGGFSDVNTDRSLQTSSFVRAWVDDLLDTASRFRKELYRLDGYVVAERIDYEDRLRAVPAELPQRAPLHERGKAVFQVSVPIEKLPELLDWLRMHSIIVEQYVVAQRDGDLPAPKLMAEQAQQRQRLEQILAALEQRMAEEEDEAERAGIEAEAESLRRALDLPSVNIQLPTVRLATLDVRFESNRPQARFSAAWIVPSVRASLFVTDLLGQDGAREARVGAAVGMGLPSPARGGLVPAPMIELAGYPATASRGAGVSLTLGGAMYARSLGEGERPWFNPFAGLRVGYAYWDAHAFAVAGEFGVELLKSSGVAWSASVRPQGLVGRNSQIGLEAGSSLSLAF